MLQRRLIRLARPQIWARAYSTPTDNPVPANESKPTERRSPVSSTNAVPTLAKGNIDAALQELEEAGEEARTLQAPNRSMTWSRSQQPRSQAMVGPRFEQTIMQDQVRQEHNEHRERC